MSDQVVIQWRANALYNLAMKKLPNNPQWMKQLFQDHPELMDLFIQCLLGHVGWQALVDRIQGHTREEAIAKATDEVATGSMTIDKIQNTLEN